MFDKFKVWVKNCLSADDANSPLFANKRMMTIAWRNKIFTIGLSLMPCFGFGIDICLGAWDAVPQTRLRKGDELLVAPDISDTTHKWIFKPNIMLRLFNAILYLRRN